MPRKGKGGSRNGTPGKTYDNRSDLNSALPKQAAPSTGPNRGYGDRKADLDAQAVVPMGPPPAAVQATGPAPGELGPLAGPTRRPHEPVTAGADKGPGPGRDALHFGGAGQAPLQAQSAFEQLAQETTDPYLLSLVGLLRSR